MATILIVDDNRPNRRFLLTLLKPGGHRFLEAGDGAEALALVRAERPDLVISDILMPTMDGYQFVRQLRSEPEIAGTAVIFFTATYHEREAQALAQSCGVLHLLSKPSHPDAILRAVHEALGLTPPAPPPPAPKEFDREHLQLLTNKLAEKVGELETVNARLTALVDVGRQLALERDPLRLVESYCQAAREIIGARHAAVGLLANNGQEFGHFFWSGLEPQMASRISSPSPKHGLLGQVLTERRPVRVANIATDPDAAAFLPPHPLRGAFLGVAIASSGQLYGVLYLIEKIGLPEFDEDNERMAVTLAAQLGVAYRSARQYEEIQRHAQRLEEEIVQREQAEEAVRASERRFRALLENSSDGISLVDGDGVILYVSPSIRRIIGHAPEGLLNRHSLELVHPDDQEVASRLLMQVLQHPGRIVGGEHRARHRDGSWRWLENTYANLITEPSVRAVVVNFRDITERRAAQKKLREYAERLQSLSRQLLAAQEAERRHIARELHDQVGQALTALKINLEGMQRSTSENARNSLNESIEIVSLTLQQVRTLSLDLRPSMLDDLGLVAALRWYLDGQARRASFRAMVSAGTLSQPLSAELSTTCFRVAQEAVTNIVRHAQARHVELDIRQIESELEMVVRDDGVGFDAPAARERASRGASLGLLGMQERVMLLGGQFGVESAPAKGTIVRVRLPLSPPLPPGSPGEKPES